MVRLLVGKRIKGIFFYINRNINFNKMKVFNDHDNNILEVREFYVINKYVITNRI